MTSAKTVTMYCTTCGQSSFVQLDVPYEGPGLKHMRYDQQGLTQPRICEGLYQVQLL